MTNSKTQDTSYDTALAIIGMSGRFPGASNVDMFWKNIESGVESIRFFSDEELAEAGVDPELLKLPNYVKAGALIDDVELFDASFFGFTPREAETMDPQHRLFLECAWEAFEGAGYAPETYKGLVGVFAGTGFCSYFLHNLYTNPQFMNVVGQLQAAVGNERDALSSTVSYKLNLKGPSVAVQTFCSTSLVAVHFACQSLLNYECDIALTGGVAIVIPQKSGYLYEEGGIVSPDGVCRAFDASSQGSVMGNGVGVVALKRLSDALEDGDPIYAVVRGSAVNNDGSTRVSYTAPGLDGQTEVIAEALGNAGVEAETISYIEAHGTGTMLGDSVELGAMKKAFGMNTQKKNFCAVGSVKPNIGHLDRASGVTGLIKATQALRHKVLPPSLHFEAASSDIDLANSPFYINTTRSEWQQTDNPRRAGVSSFGLGGTNAHVVLEEAPEREPSSASRPWQLFLLSAKTEGALENASANLAHYLQDQPDINFADAAYTLQVGRSAFNYRQFVVAEDRESLVSNLLNSDTKRYRMQQTHRDREVAFLLPGVGEQYVGLAQELYQHEPYFHDLIDTCCQTLQPYLGKDLREILYPQGESAGTGNGSREERSGRNGKSTGIDLRALLARNKNATSPTTSDSLTQTIYAQPAVFIIEYALSQLLMHWGIRPSALLGYSLGEYVAACIAGVISLEDALYLVTKRAQMIETLPAGRMLAVALTENAVQYFLDEHISLAAVTGPNTCVLAGPAIAITHLEERLLEQGIATRSIETTHAFHSSAMEPLRQPLTELMQGVSLHAPTIPYLSNVTGTWITTEQATSATYWADHMCQTVRFAEGVGTLLQETACLPIEVGAGQSLSAYLKQHPACDEERTTYIVSTLPASYERQFAQSSLLTTLGKLWLSGVSIDWDAFYEDERRLRVLLPTYPFERQRYWVEPGKESRPAFQSSTLINEDDEEKIADLSDWFYRFSWKQTLPHIPFSSEQTQVHGDFGQCWVLFQDTCGIGERIREQLRLYNQDVVTVKPGKRFLKQDDFTYTVRPSAREDYAMLLKDLRGEGKKPHEIVHLWTVTENTQSIENDRIVELGFSSLVTLAQALGDLDVSACTISIISNDMQDVMGNEYLSPAKATVIGPCKVIPQEYAHIHCRSIDIELPGSGQIHSMIESILGELTSPSRDTMLALRGSYRWAQTFEPIQLTSDQTKTDAFREHGAYLITGGLGGIGLAMAEYLAKTYDASLILTSRTGLPPRSEWLAILEEGGDDKGIGRQIRKVLQLEELGATVLVMPADVSSEEQMREVVHQACARFGTLHGVLHTAGIPASGIMQLKTPEMAANVLAPKVQGTEVLARVLHGISLDFLVLFSSMSSATGGGPGQVDYCAANAFLDAYAHRHFAEHGMTLSIDWGEWQWDAWEAGLSGYPQEAQIYFKERRQRFGISFEEGTEALRRILSRRLPHVVVSTEEFRRKVESSKNFSIAVIMEKLQQYRQSTAASNYARPVLGTEYVAPCDDLERSVADIWAELLGIKQVGIHDNFFELGGHSLMGTQLISRLRHSFDVDLPLATLFESPTVAELALAIKLTLLEEIDIMDEETVEELI